MTEVAMPYEPEPISEDTMKRLVELVTKARTLELELERLGEEADLKSKELMAILGGYQNPGALVTLLQETGVSEITLLDGTRVVVDEELKAPSMAAAGKYRPIVVDWLRKSGKVGVIKNELTVNIAPGQDALADEVEKFAAQEKGLQCKRFETVNAQTLGALLREMLENGEDVPLDQIGATVFRRAEILEVKLKEKKS